MITPDQIAANIAASHQRKQQRREEQQRQNAEQQRAAKERRERRGYPQYNGKLVGFVVKTRHDKFKPFVGRAMNMPDDEDALLHVIGYHPPQETLAEAVALFAPDRDKLALVLEKPVPSHGLMGHWLKPMLACQND